MLTNATLYRIDTPGPVTTGGGQTWVNGGTLSVPCYLRGEKMDTAEESRQAQVRKATLRVMPFALAAALAAAGYSVSTLATEQRVCVAARGESPSVYRVRTSDLNSKGGLSFIECQLEGD